MISKLFVSLCVTLAVAATPALAGPFGIEKGTRASDLKVREAHGDGPYKTYTIEVPQPNDEFTFYTVDVTDSTGVCRLTAFGKSHFGDKTGVLVRAVYESFKAALTRKYGRSEDFDYIEDDSTFTRPDQYARGLDNDTRHLVSFWTPDSTVLPPDIKAISLRATAIDGDDTYIVLKYEFSNYSECLAQKPRDDSEGL